MRAIASLVVVLLLAPAAAQERGHDPLDGVIQHAWYLRPETTNHCTVADMVLRIARDAGVAAGVEFVPGDCDYGRPVGRPDPGNWIPLLGLTFREAIAQIRAFDPRYHVIESEGVIVMRPIEAWGDDDHFLNQPIGEFRLDGERADIAIDRLWRVLSRWPDDFGPLAREFAAQTEQAGQPIDIDLPAASGVLVLDALARAHGALSWSVRYCRPEFRPEFATIGVRTYDTSGWGRRLWPSVPTGDGDRLIDPCRR